MQENCANFEIDVHVQEFFANLPIFTKISCMRKFAVLQCGKVAKLFRLIFVNSYLATASAMSELRDTHTDRLDHFYYLHD